MIKTFEEARKLEERFFYLKNEVLPELLLRADDLKDSPTAEYYGDVNEQMLNLKMEMHDLTAGLRQFRDLCAGRLPSVYTPREWERLLIDARIAGKISPNELAERLGVRETNVLYYEESLYKGITLDYYRKVCQVLGINPIIRFS